ncbi:hypothetical protein BS78_K245800 [Paspalum vaginatum]|uniref:Uncharacterized protein n=1 Tax=Paspalum vaginatum TaxID=158149 RepID=A0A9W8CD89_9POAL|nr:hypothetical protein BS78_K245800 [Paspalum vaginatum]
MATVPVLHPVILSGSHPHPDTGASDVQAPSTASNRQPGAEEVRGRGSLAPVMTTGDEQQLAMEAPPTSDALITLMCLVLQARISSTKFLREAPTEEIKGFCASNHFIFSMSVLHPIFYVYLILHV